MTVNPVLPVSVTVAADANPVCAGTTVNFTATPTNGGAAPVYQWKVNGVNAGVNAATYSYIPVTGDIVTVDLTSNAVCPTGNPATSAPVTMTVNPVLPVSVTVAADANPVCAGTTVNFTATPTNGGAAPVYQWKVNGVNAGVNAATYSYIPVTGDIVTVDLTSNAVCPTGNPATSAPVTITVNPSLPVSVTMAADANPVCAGTAVNLTAIATNGGAAPVYQWKVNGVNAGVNAATYSYIPVTGDIVTVDLTSNAVCPTGNPATSAPVTMSINPLPTATTTHVDVACFGGNTGTATVIPSGGTGVYNYSWNTLPVQTSITATSLSAGTYIVTVSDGNSCTATATAIIAQPAAVLSGSITSQTNVSVPGGNNGSVTVAGSGGTSPYQYKIGAGAYQVSGTFGTLTAGVYTVTVQDINLCTFDVAVTITQPAATVSGSITSQTNVSCFGASNGSVTVAGSGGVTPYEYSLNAGPYLTSGTFGSLSAGTYTVTVRDAVLSTVDVSITISQPASALAGVITSQTNVLCFNSNTGSVSVAGSGGVSPYVYKLGSGSYQASGTFGSLTAGSYTVTVQDANLCTFNVLVTISQPAATLTGPITTQTNVSCFGSTNGSVSISGSGGTAPYMYNLNGGAFQASGTFSGLAGASYTVTVQDANLCTVNVPVTISEPAALSISSTSVSASCPGVTDGSISLTITGGTQPYLVIWSDGTLTNDRLNIKDGTYSVVVTDKNGCAASLDIVVSVVGTDQCVEIPTIITPNNDGFNDTWQIKNIDLFPNAEVFVFTRWGKLVFHSKNLSANQWDGTFNGTQLPTDSYHYILHLNDGYKPRSGVISIIR
jgi:gliding motility-associated-like protein